MNIKKYLFLALALLFSSSAFSFVFPLSECSSLGYEKTALLVYMPGCVHCQYFAPVYESISNKEKYKSWKFYKVTHKEFTRICQRETEGCPSTYINQLRTVKLGAVSAEELERFLDGG